MHVDNMLSYKRSESNAENNQFPMQESNRRNGYLKMMRKETVSILTAVGIALCTQGCSSNNNSEQLNNGMFSNYGQMSQTATGVVEGIYPVNVSQAQGGTQTVVGANTFGNVIGNIPIGNNGGFFQPIANGFSSIGAAIFGSAMQQQYHPIVKKGVEVLVKFDSAPANTNMYNQNNKVYGKTIGILQTPAQAQKIMVGESVVVVQNKQTGACTIFPEQTG